jgi:hypothetical protein
VRDGSDREEAREKTLRGREFERVPYDDVDRRHGPDERIRELRV